MLCVAGLEPKGEYLHVQGAAGFGEGRESPLDSLGVGDILCPV